MNIYFANLTMMAGALLCCMATDVFAADYVFSFSSHSEHFELDRADNKANLIAMHSLLQNFHGVEGFHFVLLGNNADDQCNTESPCNEPSLLQRRIEAIAGDPAIQPFAADLQWRIENPSANSVNSTGNDEIKLMIEAISTPVVSSPCAYELQIADPDLPPLLPTASSKTWVDVNKLPIIHVSSGASMRLHTINSNLAVISAKQVLSDANRDLGSDRAEIQWTASQLFWQDGSADIEISVAPAARTVAAQTRDIGDVLRPAFAPTPTETPSGSESNSCHIHFVLSN